MSSLRQLLELPQKQEGPAGDSVTTCWRRPALAIARPGPRSAAATGRTQQPIPSWPVSGTRPTLLECRAGAPPQRFNPDKGGMESMELSHEPIPFRNGGTSFVPRWPQDHAAVDPFRRPGY
jgi:hypothetical protein